MVVIHYLVVQCQSLPLFILISNEFLVLTVDALELKIMTRVFVGKFVANAPDLDTICVTFFFEMVSFRFFKCLL